jgi:hypothetical protein
LYRAFPQGRISIRRESWRPRESSPLSRGDLVSPRAPNGTKSANPLSTDRQDKDNPWRKGTRRSAANGIDGVEKHVISRRASCSSELSMHLIAISVSPIASRGAALRIAHRRLAAKTIAVPPTLCHERTSPKISRPRNAMSISIGIRCLS